MKFPSENNRLTADQNIDSDFWTIKDLSKYLKVKIKTLYSMLSNIPHYRIGKLIRFKKTEIDEWLKNKKEDFQDIKKIIIKKRGLNKPAINNIDTLIRKTIDGVKQEEYNYTHGKSDRIEAQGKEN